MSSSRNTQRAVQPNSRRRSEEQDDADLDADLSAAVAARAASKATPRPTEVAGLLDGAHLEDQQPVPNSDNPNSSNVQELRDRHAHHRPPETVSSYHRTENVNSQESLTRPPTSRQPSHPSYGLPQAGRHRHGVANPTMRAAASHISSSIVSPSRLVCLKYSNVNLIFVPDKKKSPFPPNYKKYPFAAKLKDFLVAILEHDDPPNLNLEKFWKVWPMSELTVKYVDGVAFYEIIIGGWGLDNSTPEKVESLRTILEERIVPLVDDYLLEAANSGQFEGQFEHCGVEYYDGDDPKLHADYRNLPGVKIILPEESDAIAIMGALYSGNKFLYIPSSHHIFSTPAQPQPTAKDVYDATEAESDAAGEPVQPVVSGPRSQPQKRERTAEGEGIARDGVKCARIEGVSEGGEELAPPVHETVARAARNLATRGALSESENLAAVFAALYEMAKPPGGG